ncbi:MAG: glycogen synthase GlgA [Rhodospirillales bacterium]
MGKTPDKTKGKAAMRVLFVASECAPLVKTGGLADVVGALPAALAAQGVEVRVLLPGYPDVMAALCADGAEPGRQEELPVPGGRGRLLSGTAAGLDLVVLEAAHLYDRPGNPYVMDNGEDWPDNADRFAGLARAGAAVAKGGLGDWRPDVIHAHDWQAGLTPLYLADWTERPAVVMTIHNMLYQGRFPAGLRKWLGLPEDRFHLHGYEYFGDISFLKAGLVTADAITTVSPGYARELMSPDFGLGLEGVLAERASVVQGILNGIDTEAWNPATDKALAKTYGARNWAAGKKANKAALEAAFGLKSDAASPLVCLISRLTEQKGIDLLLAALPALLDRGGRLVALGSGDRDLEAALQAAVETHPGRVGLRLGYDENLAHLMQAGADAIVVPSRFEPCGLTQLYGLRYGTLPLVARTGGLGDSIIEANPAALAAKVATGFLFDPDSVPSLADAFARFMDAMADKGVRGALVRAGMATDVSWDASAKVYAALYTKLRP